MHLLVTGGCGYVGTVLVESLLSDGHQVTVVDAGWFGNKLKPNAALEVKKKDIRNINYDDLEGVSTIIHLANIANDPAVELNPSLSWEVNVLASHQLADLAVRSGVKHFIYASSGSVYGIKDEEDVTEDLSLMPISTYNKTKMVSERVFLSYVNSMHVHCIRPATVCGWSPRMRLDVSVNMLTFQALSKGKILVFGGEQTRPNIHIHDMIGVYKHFLNNPEIASGCYNAGFENISIRDLANKIAEKIPSEIEIQDSIDNRSYRQNSDKLISTGYKRNFGIDDAIEDLKLKYQSKALLDLDEYYTVKWMKKLNLDISIK